MSGTDLHDGKIVSFDEAKQKWNFVCDSEPDEVPYLMAYAAVYKYVDVSASTFRRYVLPPDPMRGDGGEAIGITTRSRTTTARGLEETSTETRRYYKTDIDDWARVTGGRGRAVDPIPWTGGDEEFSVKITDEELESLKDERGEIRFEKLLQWSLPRFGDDDVSLFEWQAKRMRNYMTMLMDDEANEKPYKPRYYNPDKGRTITGDHVARFYGALLAKMLSGNPSNKQMFSTREIFDACEPVKNSMTLDAIKDLTRCLQFADDWEEEY